MLASKVYVDCIRGLPDCSETHKSCPQAIWVSYTTAPSPTIVASTSMEFKIQFTSLQIFMKHPTTPNYSQRGATSLRHSSYYSFLHTHAECLSCVVYLLKGYQGAEGIHAWFRANNLLNWQLDTVGVTKPYIYIHYNIDYNIIEK